MITITPPEGDRGIAVAEQHLRAAVRSLAAANAAIMSAVSQPDLPAAEAHRLYAVAADVQQCIRDVTSAEMRL